MRTHIGSSDVGAILGVDPHRSPTDVWLALTGRGDPQTENQFMTAGKMLEPVILDLAANEFGQPVRHHPQNEVIIHPSLSWAGCTPDGFLGDGTIVEVKAILRPGGWRDWDGESAPPHYILQCLWQLACVPSAPEVALVALHGGLIVRHVFRNDEQIKKLEDRISTWREKHIVSGEVPEYDESDSWRKYMLSQVAEFEAAKEPPPATPENEELLRGILECRTGIGVLEEKRKALEARLMSGMIAAKTSKISAPFASASVTTVLGQISYKHLAQEVLDKNNVPDSERERLNTIHRGQPITRLDIRAKRETK